MDAYTAILARRSVRAYQDKPVSEELLTRLMEAAMAAPTGCNAQPWEFLIVNTPGGMAEMRAVMPHGKYNAPAAIVVCANLKKALNNCAERFWEQDTSAAMENILVAAAGEGLGSVWLGCHPDADRQEALRKTFGIPGHVIPMGVAYIGWPAETPEPRTQYEPGRVHWGRWESSAAA